MIIKLEKLLEELLADQMSISLKTETER